MTTKLDTMIAPRALTAIELAQVAAPHLIIYGVAHRAFIHARVLQDDSPYETAAVYAAEEALSGVVDDALSSVSTWLADMEGDGTPRFYRKASVKEVLAKLCGAVGSEFAGYATEADVAAGIADLTDRAPSYLNYLIERAGE